MINPYDKGCGRDINTVRKGCVYCGDSDGYFCKSCEFIKELIKLIDTLNVQIANKEKKNG